MTITLHIAVHGGWSDYEEWSDCSVTCGEGKKTRTRTCTKPAPLHGGDNCKGDALDTQPCKENPCPGKEQFPG